ncbi:hypothetical protein QMA10_12370 [Arthrobacter sp. APC 3897]|uniref:hypothetical protein n=1 Tax=Arthrobacter sp. APC 3897 TaxID=3035204 RepID=UPI0025B4756D|nr:hypothetical protein [Arthrobacter sp. APC 3897]MDN3482715.1 hypothetical protein [Arthrobacter sp. APC 3897]
MNAPFLVQWFSHMDSDEPERVLELVGSDFQLSVLFSGGTDSPATDFSGDRQALVGYLEQRLKNTRTHHVLNAVTSGGDEMVIGEVRQQGEFEASFSAVARLDSEGKASRLLMGRTPGVRFETP